VVGGTVTAIVLVLVSPNMQYPQAVRAEASRTLAMENMEIQTLQQRFDDPASTSSVRDASTAALANARRLRAVAKASLDGLGQTTTSVVGLQRPLINLRNPGIVSIPLGVILLIFGSLIYSRGPTADDKWRELVFRRDSGIGIDKAVGH